MRARATYESVARTILWELDEINVICADIKDDDRAERTAANLLAYAKQRVNTCLRSKKHLHRSLYLKKAGDGVWEHPVPIDLAWEFANDKMLVEIDPHVKLLAKFLKENIFIRVFMSRKDNAIVNAAYPKSSHRMPDGWRAGDNSPFDRYADLGLTKCVSLYDQLRALQV